VRNFIACLLVSTLSGWVLYHLMIIAQDGQAVIQEPRIWVMAGEFGLFSGQVLWGIFGAIKNGRDYLK